MCVCMCAASKDARFFIFALRNNLLARSCCCGAYVYVCVCVLLGGQSANICCHLERATQLSCARYVVVVGTMLQCLQSFPQSQRACGKWQAARNCGYMQLATTTTTTPKLKSWKRRHSRQTATAAAASQLPTITITTTTTASSSPSSSV